MAQAPQGNFFSRMFQGGSNNNPGNPPLNQGGNQNQAGNQNVQQSQNPQQGPGTYQQNQSPGNNGSTNDPNTMQSPLDVYKNLWQNPENTNEQAPEFKIDQKVLDNATNSLDFTRNLPSELAEKLQGLGEQGPIMLDLLNHVGRQAYANAIQHNSLLTGKFLDIKGKYDQKGLGRTIKEQLALTGIDTHKAAQNSPIVRENLRMIAQNLTRQYPDASPEWIQEKAVAFFTEMYTSMNPQNTQAQTAEQQRKAPGGEEFDWGNWMKTGPGAQG